VYNVDIVDIVVEIADLDTVDVDILDTVGV
jgi:hypothetical protein